jgi:hypothetical protein
MPAVWAEVEVSEEASRWLSRRSNLVEVEVSEEASRWLPARSNLAEVEVLEEASRLEGQRILQQGDY